MVVLGIANNDYAGACIVNNGLVAAAALEERFTRVKADAGFPTQSIDYVLGQLNLSLQDVDLVAYSWHAGFNAEKHALLYFDRIVEEARFFPSSLSSIRKRLNDEIHNDQPKRQEFERFIQQHQLANKVVYIDHHESHAKAAYLCSPFNEAIAISCDGRGDFQSLTVTHYKNDDEKTLQKETTFDSLGYFYGRITRLLGFKPNRHEGKITGLAAHGDPTKLLPLMESLINIDVEGRIRAQFGQGYLPSYDGGYPPLEQATQGEKAEDIAAAAQAHLENILLKLISRYVDKRRPNYLCLAGGVFGNVKLNQRLRELEGVKGVYVLPCMGDDGLALGAAVCALYQKTKRRVLPPSMKLGPAVASTMTLLKQLKKQAEFECMVVNKEQIQSVLLNALRANLVLGMVKGNMEYGPRALCNRSIIARASDPAINTWLNQKMNRTEFMPFAPITAANLAQDCFVGWDENHIASRYMTMTYDCTPYFANHCPAVTHIDGTARPQVVFQEDDPFIHQLLMAWHQESGEPGLINTSFNMHEEPIVNTAQQALTNLQKKVVDLLVINEELLVWNKNQKHLLESLNAT